MRSFGIAEEGGLSYTGFSFDVGLRGTVGDVQVFGRLRDGVTADRAAAEMAGIAARLAEQYPESYEGVAAVVRPYVDKMIGEESLLLKAVDFGAVLLILLVACFNVTNLLLARSMGRARELAQNASERAFLALRAGLESRLRGR